MLKSNAIGAFPFPKVLSWTLRNLYDSVVNEIKTGHFFKMKIHIGVIYFQNSIKKYCLQILLNCCSIPTQFISPKLKKYQI